MSVANMVAAAVALFVAAGAIGLAYGVAVRSPERQRLGLKICQGGFAMGGLVWIGSAIFLGDASSALYGLLLLVFGTGITGIGSPSRLRGTGRNHFTL